MQTLRKYSYVTFVALLSTPQAHISEGLVTMDSKKCLVTGGGPSMGADRILCDLECARAAQMVPTSYCLKFSPCSSSSSSFCSSPF